MKVVAFNGSPWSGGNTATLVRWVFAELEAEGIQTELVELAGAEICNCPVCRGYVKSASGVCNTGEHQVGRWLERMTGAQGVILASPVHHATVTDELKALMDRCGRLERQRGNLLERKVGAAVVAARRAGGIQALDAINRFFTIHRMLVPGTSQWNIGIGEARGDVEDDAEGRRAMAELGRSMAWLIKAIRASSDASSSAAEEI